MTANLTPVEARAWNAAVEAAARCVASNGHPALADELRVKCVPIPPEPVYAGHIDISTGAYPGPTSILPPIPPKPDAEAVVEMLEAAMHEAHPQLADCTTDERVTEMARAVVAALTAANLLRS